MKKNRISETMIKACIAMAILVLLISIAGCREYAEHGGIGDRIKQADAKAGDESEINSVPAPAANTVQTQMNYQGGPFRTETRKERIGRFQCSQCHGSQVVRIDQAAELAHGDIVIRHGAENKRLACRTCHDDKERNFLTTDAGEKIDFDHSYQVCGQCHFRQKNDWIGGAHGKRVSYWAGKRTVMNCTSCHNPHAPKFEKRWPATFSPPLS